MLTITAVVCLGLLLWIATTMARIVPAIEALRRKCGSDPLRPDADYPAFPRDQINHAYDMLAKTLDESIAAETRLFAAPGWKDITSGGRLPDTHERNLMHDSAFATLMWEVVLSRCQFLTEANSRVRHGDWTIAQAHYFYRDLEPPGFTVAGEARSLVDQWCSRFQNKGLDEEPNGYKDRMRPYDSAREEFLRKWKEQFKAMHVAKVTYHHGAGDEDSKAEEK